MSMSNTTILRKVYAFDSVTGNALSTGQTLVTDGLGGTSWIPYTGTVQVVSQAQLASTIGSLTTLGYISSQTLRSTVAGSQAATLSTISTTLGQYITQSTLTSTIAAYTSASTFTGTLASYMSTPTVYSTLSTYVTMPFLSTSLRNYASLNLLSNYVSTTALNGILANFISTPTFTSTLVDYYNTRMIRNTLNNYMSTPTVYSTIAGSVNPSSISTFGFVNGATVGSMIAAIPVGATGGFTQAAVLSNLSNTFQPILTSNVSTAVGQAANINFDTATSVGIANSRVTFLGPVANIIYVSTIFNSSIGGTVVNCNLQPMAAYNPPGTNDMVFSSIYISNLTPFLPYINSKTLVTLDIYPNFAFTKLGTAATTPAIIPISTIVRYGSSNLLATNTTTFLYAGNTQSYQSQTGTWIDASNMYSSPIRITIPPGTFVPAVTNMTILHTMPNSVQNGQSQNALHSTIITPYMDTSNCIFISLQNIPRG